jgi:hypothetical protein
VGLLVVILEGEARGGGGEDELAVWYGDAEVDAITMITFLSRKKWWYQRPPKFWAVCESIAVK